MTPDGVRSLEAIKPLAYHGLVPKMLAEVQPYLAACVGVFIDSSANMTDFTEALLRFWRHNESKFPAWAEAARIVFSLTPNSAAAERVFSLLKLYAAARDTARATPLRAPLHAPSTHVPPKAPPTPARRHALRTHRRPATTDRYFGEERCASLADLVEGSLMLKYNNTKRKLEKATRQLYP